MDLLEKYQGDDRFEIIIEAQGNARYQLAFPNNRTHICRTLQNELSLRFGSGADDVDGVTAATAYELRTADGVTNRMTDRKIRVLVAKPGLDGHDRGAKVVARALRDAGMEVIYTGIRQTPEMIAEAALQEDVDVVGLSILSGAHMALCPAPSNSCAEGLVMCLVLVGGIIPDDDIEPLKQAGVKGVFGPGTSTHDIIEFIRTQTKD